MLRQIALSSLRKSRLSCQALAQGRSVASTALLSEETWHPLQGNQLTSARKYSRVPQAEHDYSKQAVRNEHKDDCSLGKNRACRYPHRKCWNCAVETLCDSLDQLYFCGSCKSLQAPVECLTHFDLLGLPRGYQLDNDALRQKMRELQSMLHPDKFSRAGDRERAFAAEHSAFVNRAYATLNDLMTRAEYCLQLEAVDLEQLRGLSQLGAQKASDGDTEFLMDIMEANEAVEEAAGSKDRARLASLRAQFAEQLTKFASDFSESYSRFQTAKQREAAKRSDSAERLLTETVAIASKMRYIRTLIDQIDKI